MLRQFLTLNFFLCLIFTLPVVKAACEAPAQPTDKSTYPGATLELKNGYFFFSDSKMRKVYDQGGWDVQLSASYPIWRWLQIYGSVEYFEKHGKSLNDHQKTSIWGVPLSLGVKPVFAMSSHVQYYFTLGMRYFFVHQRNHSSYVDKHVDANGLGGFVNTGLNFILGKHFLIDTFGEYSYKRLHFHSHKHNVSSKTMQVGGFAFGVGLGYAF